MDTETVANAEGLLRESFTALHNAAGSSASPDDLVAVLRLAAAAEREIQRVTVETVAAMQRRGVFAEHGQRPHTALCGSARDRTRRGPPDRHRRRTGLPADRPARAGPAPLLPGAAAAFAAGTASLRHVEVIARLLAGPAAQRLPLDTAAEAGSPDRRQDRRVHPDRAAQLGQQTDRHARPGRRRTRRRPGTRAGQRTVVDPQPQRVRRPAQGPVRQRRGLRSRSPPCSTPKPPR